MAKNTAGLGPPPCPPSPVGDAVLASPPPSRRRTSVVIGQRRGSECFDGRVPEFQKQVQPDLEKRPMWTFCLQAEHSRDSTASVASFTKAQTSSLASALGQGDGPLVLEQSPIGPAPASLGPSAPASLGCSAASGGRLPFASAHLLIRMQQGQSRTSWSLVRRAQREFTRECTEDSQRAKHTLQINQ